MKFSILLTSLAFCLSVTTVAFAQTNATDYPFTPGTTINITVSMVEPVCWVNAAHEFNVYFKSAEGMTLLTLLNETDPKLGKLPAFNTITLTDYSFLLSTEDKKDYYFAAESDDEKKVLQLLKYTHPTFTESHYGYGVAKHNLGNRKITLEQLKAAKSVYDVLEKL
jgi:hypothetical protein